jgi:molecular chaperone GrpE
LRVSADFQNYKRRMEKDRLTWIREGMVKALEVILPLVDDLARALSASKQTSEDSSLATGIELVVKSLEKRLDELGVEGIDCSGQFDPHVHEALMEVESPDHESGQIIDVLERGYMISGNIIRHAKVSVAK